MGTIGQAIRVFEAPTEEDLKNRWKHVPKLTLDALGVVWRASRRQLIKTLVLQAGAGAAMTLQLLAAQKVLQKLLLIAQPQVSGSDLIVPFAILIGAMIVMGALTALAEQSQRLLGELVGQHAVREIIGISTRVELAAFENPDFHDQLERARNSAISRSIMMVSSLSGLTLGLLTSAGIGVALLLLEPLLLPLVVISALPMLFATVMNSRRAYRFEWGMTPANRERAYLMELLTKREAAKELRVFGATSFLRDRYDDLNLERLTRMREFLRERLGVALLGTVATTVGMGMALGALAFMIATGRVPVATALTAGAAMQQLSTRLFGMMSSLGQLVESGMFVDDYNSFLKLLPKIEAEEEEHAATSASNGARPRFNGLRVSNVSFAYPAIDKPVLRDVSLEVNPGEVVALVGENGSGKTTLVKLICQLYQASAGQITWPGPEGRPIEPEEIRGDITVVFQDFLQYFLTAAENIALGRVERDPSPEAVHGAAAQAGADGFLMQLPKGYDTRLGRQFNEGHDLSVGQWQRLALARAFFRGGGFLVLDEPTASLDPKAEHELFQQMRKLWRGRSVLLVSHRFSSVRSADRIYVMSEGCMIEDGSHAELMAAEGHYAELFSLQAAAYLGEPGESSTDGAHKNKTPIGVSQA